MKPPKAEATYALVCEDIRTEASQRLSLMGVYGPLMDVVGLPGILPTLCAIAFVRNPVEPIDTVTIAVIDPNGTSLGENTQKVKPIKDEQVLHQFHVRIAPFPLATEGVWTFRFTFNGDPDTGLETTIKIRLQKTRQQGSDQPAM